MEHEWWFKFEPAVWRSDMALRKCSGEARGVWMELYLCMREGNPPGHLTDSETGQPLTMDELVQVCGLPQGQLERGMAELQRRGVYSLNDQGVPFCRKLVRELAISRERSKAARSRWDRPSEELEGDGGFASTDEKENASSKQHARSDSDSKSSFRSDSDSSEGSLRGDSQVDLPGTVPAAPPTPKKRARATRTLKPGIPPELQALFDAHQRCMHEHRGAVHVTPATKANLESAARILEAAAGDVDRAVRLVELYVHLTEDQDEFVARNGWAFRWIESRCSRLSVLEARSTETTSDSCARDLREMIDMYLQQGLTDDEIRSLMSEEDLRRAGRWPLPKRRRTA